MSRRVVQVEFAVRTIDERGDCYDVGHRDDIHTAVQQAVSIREEARLTAGSECAAVVIEKETMREDGDVERETVFRMGSKDALRKGGWL